MEFIAANCGDSHSRGLDGVMDNHRLLLALIPMAVLSPEPGHSSSENSLQEGDHKVIF